MRYPPTILDSQILGTVGYGRRAGNQRQWPTRIMTVSKERLTDRMGLLSPDEMRGVDMAVRIQLGLAA